MNVGGTLTQAQPLVLTHVSNGIATLTLNRAERFNPLSSEMIAAIHAELNAISRNPAVRVVILAAEGKGFCAGHDLKEMRAHSGDKSWQRRLFDDCSRMMMALTELPQPVIARVHGIATAAGCQLVSMCDLAVAADTARFAMPGVNIGVFCSTVRSGKQAFYGQVDRPLQSAYDIASEAMASNLLLEDAAEGMDAFLEKRAASWRGK